MLRRYGISFQPSGFVSKDWVTLAAWIGLVFYMIRLRRGYMLYLSSPVRTENDSRRDYAVEHSVPTTEELETPLQKQISKHSAKEKSLKPEMQVKIGEVSTYLIIAMSCYIYVSTTHQLKPTTLLVNIIFFLITPLVYIYALRNEMLIAAKTSYRVWLSFVLLLFIFYAFRKLILMGEFSNFLRFWAPLGVSAICLWVGQRGLARIIKPATEEGSCDTIPWIFMCIGMFLGFFIAGKATHDFLTTFWPNIPHYEIRWALPCSLGAIAGSIAGGLAFSFVGFFVEAIRQTRK
jgi:hypothetical protein